MKTCVPSLLFNRVHRLSGTSWLAEGLLRFHPESMSPTRGVCYHSRTHVVEQDRVRLCVLSRLQNRDAFHPGRAREGEQRNKKDRRCLGVAADLETQF